jgi:hypothetical protein
MSPLEAESWSACIVGALGVLVPADPVLVCVCDDLPSPPFRAVPLQQAVRGSTLALCRSTVARDRVPRADRPNRQCYPEHAQVCMHAAQG